MNAAPLGPTPPPAQPFRVSYAPLARNVGIVGLVCAVLGVLCLVQAFLTGREEAAGGWPVWGVLALLLGGFGVWALVGARNIRRAGMEIGPEAITVSARGHTVRITWAEIGRVGISILSSGGGDIEAARPVLGRPRGRSVMRIRLAGVSAGFPEQPELRFFTTHDEPDPYTHVLPLQPPNALGDRFAVLDPAARALAAYGGARYAGIEERRVTVGRYR